MTDLQPIIESTLAVAKKNLERDGSTIPILISVAPSGNKLLALQFGSTEEKRAVYKHVVDFVIHDSPEALITVNDAWMKSAVTTVPDAAQQIERARKYGISEDPDRQECLIVCVSERDGEDRVIIYPYSRVEGEVVFGERSEDHKDFENMMLPKNWKQLAKEKA